MKKLISITIACICMHTAYAQEPLSLGEAISKTLSNNFDIKIEEKNIDIAQRNNNWAEAGRYPEINGNASSNNQTVFNQPANPFALAGTNFTNTLAGNLDIQWVLFNGLRVRLAKDQLALFERQSEANATVTIETTIENVVNAYYQAVLEKENIDVLKKVLYLSRDRLEYVRLRKDLGSGSTFDIVQEETVYYTDSTNYVNQSLVINNAIRNLNFLMAETDINRDYELTDKLSSDMPVYTYDVLKDRLEERNSVLQQQKVNELVAQSEVEIQKRALSPRVTLNAGYNATQIWFTADFPVASQLTASERPSGEMNWGDFLDFNSRPRELRTETRSGYNLGPFANVLFTVPIYANGRNRRAVQNAKVSYEISKVQTQQTELGLAQELYNALDLYRTRQQIASISLKSKQAAETSLELSEERFKLGTINSFEYRLVQINYLTAAQAELDALYNLAEANSAILRLTGGIIDLDLQP